LLAVGGTADMRRLTAAPADDEDAALAIEMFAQRAAEGIAAAATSLRALHALVFTGGIGENAADVRARIAGRLGALGISSVGDRDDDGPLTEDGAEPVVLRIEAREDVVIAGAALELAQS
jgi:acetate kinase